MANDLFGNDNDSQQQQDLNGEEALKLLVGEGAKYGTVEDLAKATLHAQQHIAQLEQENKTMRDAATDNGKGLTEVLDAIKALSAERPQSDDDNQQPASPQESTDVQALIQSALDQHDRSGREAANERTVKETLEKSLGQRAAEAYKAAGKSLGLDIDKLAKESPQAVINLVLGTQQKQGTLQSSASGHTAPTEHRTGVLTYAEIQEQYKAGKLTRNQKHAMEASSIVALGSNKFWNK